MDEEQRALLVAKAMFVFGVACIAVALLGEFLGWWNDFGELLGLVGIVVTGFALAIGLLVGATRRQVGRAARAVEQGNAILATLRGKQDDANAKLDGALARHDATNAKLGLALGKHDATNTRLDQQTRVLEDIRDLLRARERGPA